MEVTCERCSTVYDFDDALVSERGTTVKCTTCGHQFKVRRTAPATGRDVWIVRTVDGREIEFAALRDLQSAIYDNRVTRDDVLVRGNSRPRRLGSIAELEPFFNRVGMTAPNPQRRARTFPATGPGAAPTGGSQRTENSAVFSLPNLVRQGTEPDAPRSVRRSTIPPPPPPMPSGGKKEVSSYPPPRRGSIPPPAPHGGSENSPPPYRRGSIPPPPPRTTARSNPTGWFGNPTDTDHDDEHLNPGIERISALPPPPPPPRRHAATASPMFPAPEPPPPLDETASAPRMFPDPEPTKVSRNPAPPEQPKGTTVDAPAAASKESASATTADKPSTDKRETASTNAADPPQESIATAGSNDSVLQERTKPTAGERPAKSPRSEPSSAPGSTPLPSSRRGEPYSDQRRSEPYSEPHHSMPVPSRRAGAARWMVGFVLLGCTALAAVTIGPKLIAKPPPTTAQPDARVATFLEQGDRAMNDGDLEAANEAYVKASALADKDARVELRLARLAIVRADIPWLKVRLLPESDPDLSNARRELDLAAARAHQATERAQAILPNDPDVTRCRIDTFRLQGNVAEARKLVASLLKPTGVSNDDVLFALLDLAEPSPTWSSVIDRLSNAARGEQNLGHARTMLIYALVQSGDVARAKTELDQLVAMPRPHPLIGAFRTYIAHAEKGASAGAPDAGAPMDDNAMLQSAIEATNSGDLEKASGLLQDLETRLPRDGNVLTAAGKLALKKKDRAAAAKYFEKAIANDKNQFDAVAALANIKWESGEKQGASILYRQIIERAGADNPHMTQAKERFSAFAEGTFDEP